MDNNGKLSDYESVNESSDAEYDSDRSASYGFSSESEIDFDDSSYDIATNPVPEAPDLGKTRWPASSLKLHGSKLLSQRMDTWIFCSIV